MFYGVANAFNMLLALKDTHNAFLVGKVECKQSRVCLQRKTSSILSTLVTEKGKEKKKTG